ncbi:hypothetical protein LWI29_030045 [Acer saccharum]|uniref:Late embryogenesis abundant protein LEA-2 subgroup domain-containing protein n=1 Tax=Acer saccharum TaxID=4024 RepID=A0AA39T789_ACESA|nr:hypothetical protein LWI29_030045 [Acer saccharum]
MLSLLSPPPPPPPPEPPSPSPPLPPPPPPPPQRLATPASLKKIVISKPPLLQLGPATNTPNPDNKKPSLLQHPRPHKNNLLIWCGATFCFIFSLLLIFFGIATLIIFLGIKTRIPKFDTPGASLNTIYFDTPDYFNGDFTFLANFSNPNRKIGVRFEYLETELYFYDKLIATQVLQPFSQQPGEARLESIHMISSLVYLPQNFAGELQKQVQSNKINYNIRASFKVKATLGIIHITYWLHSRCQLEMTGPPTGVLVARNCRTKRSG